MRDAPRAEALTDTNGAHGGYVVFCPGCEQGHLFDARWKFNGDLERPTFTPSMLVNGSRTTKAPRCHSYVTDGRIQFLGDCDHALAGQTVDLPPASRWTE